LHNFGPAASLEGHTLNQLSLMGALEQHMQLSLAAASKERLPNQLGLAAVAV